MLCKLFLHPQNFQLFKARQLVKTESQVKASKSKLGRSVSIPKREAPQMSLCSKLLEYSLLILDTCCDCRFLHPWNSCLVPDLVFHSIYHDVAIELFQGSDGPL